MHDLTPAHELLHGDEEVIYGDAAYQGIAKRPEMARTGADVRMGLGRGKRRVKTNTPEGRLQDLIEAAKVHIIDKVEHIFRVFSQQFGFQKTRLRDLAKTAAKIM